jgi:hypothetical protein
MRNTTVNLGPLLVTLAVVFTTYFAGALAMPMMPGAVQQALASLPALPVSPSLVACDSPVGR